MVPIWPRTRRLGSPYAYALLDLLLAILWFSAFISVAVWNSAGGSSCDDWSHGSAAKCRTSEACVGLGVILWLSFVAAAWLSGKAAWRYRRGGGVLPSPSNDGAGVEGPYSHGASNVTDAEAEVASKDPWSTELDLGPGDRLPFGQGTGLDDDAYLLHSTATNEGRHPGLQISYDGGAGTLGQLPFEDGRQMQAQSALSPTGYEGQTPLGQVPQRKEPYVSMPRGNYGFE